MHRLNQSIGRVFSLPRWSLLGLSALAPIIFLTLLLLSASIVVAEPSSPTANVSGVVLAPDGTPLIDTTWVRLAHLDPWGWEDWETEVETAPDGSFNFTETVPVEYLPGDFIIQAYAPWDSPYCDSLPVELYIENDVDPIDVGLVYLTFPSFWGTVYEPDGITPAQWGWVGLEEFGWGEVAGGDYDDTGWYEIGGVPDGDFNLIAYPADDSLFASSAPISVSVLPGSQYDPDMTQYIDLTLQEPNVYGWVVYPDGALAGWIYSGTASPENAIGQAWVKAVSEDWSVDMDRYTIPSGEFGFLLPPNNYHIWAEPEGVMALDHTRSIPRPVHIEPGDPLFETGPLTLTFPSFVGEVLGPGGFPIPDCVYVWLEDMMGNWVVDHEYCPPMGPINQHAPEQGPLYRLGGIPAGDYWLMTDGLPDYGLLPAEPILVHVPPGSQYDPDATMWFDLWLEPAAGPLTVEVVDPFGNPAPAHVTLMDDWGDEIDWQDSFPGEPAQFWGLAPGDYWVQAWPMEHDIPMLANSEMVPVWLDGPPITITLDLLFPNVIGTIETPEGNPLPPAFDDWGNPVPHPAQIHVHNWDWSIDVWAMTNISGDFALALPHGDYELRAMPMWSLNMSYTKSLLVEFPIPDPGGAPPPLDLGFIPLTYARVWGWVLDPGDNPVSTDVDLWNASGTYWDWDDTWAGDPMYPGEPFRFGGLPPGHYFVQAQPPWDNPLGLGVSNIEDFFVPPHLTQQITLYLGMANFIGDLRLPPDSDCPGCPVPWADVRLRDAAWTFEEQTTTGVDGRFTFSGLEPGVPYVVEVIYLPGEFQFDWNPPPPEHFTLASPEDQVQRVLHLRPALHNKLVFGEVTDQNGFWVDDGMVYAYHDPSGLWADTPTGPSGNYDLYLGPGLWWVGVQPMYPGADWFFDPWEEVPVWFSDTLDIEQVMVNLTVTRYNPDDFFLVTGLVTTPNGVPIVPGTVEAELCNDEGGCFGNPVMPNGEFELWALPGGYHFSIWVDPDSGLWPPLRNNFPIHVDDDIDLGMFLLRGSEARSAQVSGRVIITPSGEGLAGVLMEAWTDEGDWAATETISRGRYLLNMFPGHWHGGPLLSEEQEEQYIILPPRHRDGHLEAGETISNVNFYLMRRDAEIRGQVVELGGTEPITDIVALVFAERCPPDPDEPCHIIAEDEVRGGSFRLHVVGGVSYTLGIWLPEGGYMPGPPVEVFVDTGATKHAQVTVIEAGTKIHGYLQDSDLNLVEVEALVYGTDPDGLWVEDHLWAGKDPYRYNLWVPTPDTDPITWTLGLWVDPSTGYVADPSHPSYEIVVQPGQTTVPNIMYVTELDTMIEGNVGKGGGSVFVPAPFIWVFAEGMPGTDSEGLYFEALSDENGDFSMYVMPGEYIVNAYLPEHLMDKFFPPVPVEWHSVGDNPVELRFRPKPTGVTALEISGALTVEVGTLGDGLDEDAPIAVFGWSPDGSFDAVTGTLRTGYSLSVISNTTWYVWAAYEDLDNGLFYHSQEEEVSVGTSDVPNVDLELRLSPYPLPGTECWNFDPSQIKRLYLPARADMFEPIVDIPAGTMPVTGTVKICATPKVAMPHGQRLVGFAYEMDAWDNEGNPITQNFNGTVRLQFYFNEAALGSADPAELIVAYYSTVRQEWIELDNPYIDLDDMFATGKINHFTKMGILSAAPEATTDNYLYLPVILKAFGG